MRAGYDLARATKAALVGLTVARGVDIRSDVVGIDAHDIAQCRVALEGEIFFVVVHVENGLCRVGHTPHHGDTDLHGVAEAVVDLLAGVVERHDLERDLLAPPTSTAAGRALQAARRSVPLWPPSTSPDWLSFVLAAGLNDEQKGLTQ